jgi:tRNA G46 methylase TrmB
MRIFIEAYYAILKSVEREEHIDIGNGRGDASEAEAARFQKDRIMG